MKHRNSPTFPRYFVAWWLGWLTVGSATVCGTALVWSWSALNDGFSLSILSQAYGWNYSTLYFWGVLLGFTLIFGLVCAGLQFLLWFLAKRFTPRLTAQYGPAISSGIGVLFGAVLFLLLLEVVRLIEDKHWHAISRVEPAVLLLFPIAAAAVLAGYGCILRRTAEDNWEGHARLWTAVTGFWVAALYILGAEAPQYGAGKWEGMYGPKQHIVLKLRAESKGELETLTRSDATLTQQDITWKEEGRTLSIVSVPDAYSPAQVIATGDISIRARVIKLHIQDSTETFTLVRVADKLID